MLRQILVPRGGGSIVKSGARDMIGIFRVLVSTGTSDLHPHDTGADSSEPQLESNLQAVRHGWQQVAATK